MCSETVADGPRLVRPVTFSRLDLEFPMSSGRYPGSFRFLEFPAFQVSRVFRGFPEFPEVLEFPERS